MAKQSGAIKLRGTIGSETYYKRGGKFFVRPKSSLTREQFFSSSSFERSRLCTTEFTHAGVGAKLIRDTFGETVVAIGDPNQYARLLGFLRRTLDTDEQHSLGYRRLACSDLSALERFNWHKGITSIAAVPLAKDLVCDPETGTVSAQIKALNPKRDLDIPVGATHYRIVLTAASFDFERNRSSSDTTRTEWRSIYEDQAAETLEATPDRHLNRHLMGTIAVFFADLVNGKFGQFPGRRSNAFAFSYFGFAAVPPARTITAEELLASNETVTPDASTAAPSLPETHHPAKQILGAKKDRGKRRWPR